MPLPSAPDLGIFSPPPFWADVANAQSGLIPFFNNVLRIIFLVAGLYAVANIFMAGLLFVNARGDTKKIESAWYKIWQSLAGLLVVLISFVAAVILGQLLFGDPEALLEIQLFGPTAN